MLDQGMTIASTPIEIGRSQRNNSGGTSNDDLSYVSVGSAAMAGISFIEYSQQDANERHQLESPRAVVHDPRFKQFGASQLDSIDTQMTSSSVTSTMAHPSPTSKLVELERDVVMLPGEYKIKVSSEETCAIQGGALMLTNYRLLFLTDTPTQFVSVFTLMEIECLDFREPNQVAISMKSGRVDRFQFFTQEEKVVWHRTLTKIVSRLNTKMKDAKIGEELNEVYEVFAWKFAQEVGNRGAMDWLKGDESKNEDVIGEDFQRLNMNEKFRITTVNKDYGVCETYPEKFIVPKSITDDDIRHAALYRGLNRLPAIVWKCDRTNATLLRSAQPQVGILAWGNQYDEKLIEEAVKAGRKEGEEEKQFIILDARTYAAAFANRARSGGFENTENYQQAKLEFLCLPNIYTVRNSFIAIRNLFHAVPHTEQLLANLQNTGWLQNLSNLLISASNCADYLSNGHSVLVHCSDGWDRTTQIVSLAKLMLDHHYRTIEGFEQLIKREWLAFGHKFFDRQQSSNGNWDAGERSPIFLQFLEAVRHLQHEQPYAFEFNHAYLIKLAQHAYSGLFGTFLFNCERERKAACKSRGMELVEIWRYLGRHNEHFVNESFKDDMKGRLKTMNFSVLNLRVWHEVFSDDENRYTNLYPRPTMVSAQNSASSIKDSAERPSSGCENPLSNSNSTSLMKSISSERVNIISNGEASNGNISHSGSNGAIASSDSSTVAASTSSEPMSIQTVGGSIGRARKGTIKEMLDRDGLIIYVDEDQEALRKKRKDLINTIKQKNKVIEELANVQRSMSELAVQDSLPHGYMAETRTSSICESVADTLNSLQKIPSDMSIVDSQELPHYKPITSWDTNPQPCYLCGKRFSSFIALSNGREHHCRNCGKIVCDSCSSKRYHCVEYGEGIMNRVCDNCYETMQNNEKYGCSALSRASSLSDMPFSNGTNKSPSFATCPSPSSISLNMTPQTPSRPIQSSCKSSNTSINSPHNSPGEFSQHGSSQAVKG